MKHLTISILFLTAIIAHAGIAGFFTQETRDWEFIQSVGGMKLSQKQNSLVVDCDVSGLRKVTVKPTTVNSALAVRKLKHTRVGNTIQLRLVTSVIEKGISTTPKPIDLSKYRAGTYSVQYLDPDGTKHNLGNATVTKPNQ
jgi:hypothetical protein